MAGNIEQIDDEELLSLHEATRKLLNMGLQHGGGQSNQKKIAMLRQKIETIEQELKARSLWEGD